MLTKYDYSNLQSLKKIIGKAEFNIKGEAVIGTASIFQWLNSLDQVFLKTIKHFEDSNKPPKKVKEPIKKKLGKE